MSSLPLIAAQPGIFVADQLNEFSNAYVVVHFLDLKGELNLNILYESIQQGMFEFDTLRMQYTTDRRGDCIQVLKGAEVLPKPEFLDLRNSQSPLKSSEEIMNEDMARPCRVGSNDVLIRHVVMQLRDDEFRWYQRFHHIQLDAYSFTALTRRIGAIYSAKIRSEDCSSSTAINGSSAPAPFATAVEEYEKYRKAPKYTKDSEFWKKFSAELPDAASICPLPVAGIQPTKNIIRNFTVLNGSEFMRLATQVTSSKKGLSNVDVALAMLSVWLLRLSNKHAMSTGFIFMRRLGSAALNTSGPFINVLPLPIQMGGTLVEMAAEVAASLRLIRKHQKYDSENIVRESNRGWDSNPLFGPVINFKAFDYNLDFENITTTTHHVASGPVRDLELVLYINEAGEVKIEYLANGTRYTKVELDNHLNRLHSMLHQFSENPEMDCSRVNLMLPFEVEQLTEINSTEHKLEGPYLNSSRTLMDLVVNQALATPTAIALSDDSEEFKFGITYSTMISEVSSLASALLKNGVKPGDIVSVAMPRSVYLSMAIQAISLAGATWLPLDPNYPWERLKLMIEDAKPSLIISNEQTSNEGRLDECGVPLYFYDKLFNQTVSLDDTKQLIGLANADSSAYIIYTSGSTGKPKGVVVGQEAIVNRLLWMKDQYGMGPSDAVLQKTSACFDVSVWEFFLPLISGSKLVMAPPNAHRDPAELKRMICEHRVTTIHFVPSMLSTFLAHSEGDDNIEWAKPLKRAFCSGEALSAKAARTWLRLSNVPLYNLYGPTEAAIDVTYSSASDASDDALYIPIGLPVWNTQMHVLNENLESVPQGVSGDLYISGIQLAKGYLNRPELTEERFIVHDGVRMYKTGDVALWLPNGQGLEFLGRSDDQVKLRGQRIELGEIDSALTAFDGISQSVTLALANPYVKMADIDSRQLVSYYVGDASKTQNVLKQLAEQLPSYMVPIKLIQVEEFPISASGKLDKRSLPPAFEQTSSDDVEKRNPSPGLEQQIADGFKDIIGCSTVYAEDDFFSLGGHSLMAVKLATHLRTKLNLPVTIGQIMQYSRVDSLAEQLGDVSKVDEWQNAGFEDVMLLNQSTQKKTLYCIHPASGFSWQFSILSRYLDPTEWNIVGIQSARTDGPLASSKHLEEVVDAHLKTLLEIHQGQEYYLLGYSLGGTLAHSLAAKLEQNQCKVAFLGLLDTWPPETQNWDAKKEKHEVDQAVVDEMQREREQFLSASEQGDTTSQRMFDIIETNYASAVNILATAKSSVFKGPSTLFVAQKTLPPGTDLQEVWKPYTNSLETHFVDCSHVDIVSPVVFKAIGPLLKELLDRN